MIMTLDEAKTILRVDYDDDDSRINNLLIAIPEYLENKTGKRWDTEPINPIAKTVSGFILQQWYEPDMKSNDLIKVINGLLVTLTTIGRYTTNE